MIMRVILMVIIYSSISVVIDGSHYRGGFITWKPQYPHLINQNPVPIILKQRHVWRLISEPCDDSMIAKKDTIGVGSVTCISTPCYSISVLASVAAPCVAYSVTNDWSVSEISTVVNISANIVFEAAFQGNAWISSLGVGGDGEWSISTGITTIPRSDGTYNTAPSCSMSSMKFLRVGSTYTWEIPVADTDGDIVRCRWAKNGSVDECASVCNGFPGAILTDYPCRMTYTATVVGTWAVALKIEDFESSSTSTPLSSSSMQFIVVVYSSNTTCETPPFYYGKQPADACISVAVGSTINEIAQFSVGCENTNLIEMDIYKPDDMIVSALKVNPLNSSLYTMNVTWTPTSLQIGANLVCYTPLDSVSQQGAQVCIKYFVNDNDPTVARSKYIDGSMKPTGQVYSNQSIWYIQYTHEVRRPGSDVYIRFYSKLTNNQVDEINVRTDLNRVIYSDNNLTFFTSIKWNLGEQYYILFDSSIVTDPMVCGPQSPPIVDTNYWTFQVVDADTVLEKTTIVTTEETTTVTTEKNTTVTTEITSTDAIPSVNYCLAPIITLIPSTSSLPSPLLVLRSEDFYISSHIKLNCNHSLSMISKWTIQDCTSNHSIEIPPKIITNFTELFIPSRMLDYGIYELKLTITMKGSSNLFSSSSAFIKIIHSTIKANLVQFGTSMISHNHHDELILNPGKYSIDPDQYTFNANIWKYEYSCRIYGSSSFESLNSVCFSNNPILEVSNSSLIIPPGSFLPNKTYQFMVHMENHLYSSMQSIGYLLVQVDDIYSHMIVIACVIQKMCNSRSAYQHLNPGTQLALFSLCTGNCSKIINISWKIYGSLNATSNMVQWNQLKDYEDHWFFGKNTKNLTALNQLFRSKPQIKYWKFEVIYSFPTKISSSALYFTINHPPQNGSCSITPATNTLFNISCPDWFDEDEIKDYSVWTYDSTQRLIIAFSSVPDFQVQFPSGAENISILIQIRDKFDCIAEWNTSFLITQSDPNEIPDLINTIEENLLISKNKNTLGQIIILLSKELNIDNIGLPTNIFVSPLGSSSLPRLLNESILNEYNKLTNIYAKIRDDWITYMMNFAILGSNSIKLQATALVLLTQSTNQLTRKTSMIASERCYQLAEELYLLANQSLYEDIYEIASLISQCVSNVMTGINGPLQKRMNVLDLDWSRANDLSREDQKQTSDKINDQSIKTISLLTSALNIHLNIDQNLTINTSSVFMILKTISFGSLSNQSIELIENAKIYIPINITNDTIISLRSIIQPLAFADTSRSNTNFSRSMSLSILDENNQELSIQTILDRPIELIIPRDPNLIIPPMILQNVISTSHNQLFHFKSINITSQLAISVHFEIYPLNNNVSYLFIYKFDDLIDLNNYDGWTLFCPDNLTNDNLYTYFINNQKTMGHQSIIYGIRELNSIEKDDFCSNQSMINPPILSEGFYFTADYKIRIYTSGCYYLDSNNTWQSDGLIVGSLTNHNQTQCYLTTFAFQNGGGRAEI